MRKLSAFITLLCAGAAMVSAEDLTLKSEIFGTTGWDWNTVTNWTPEPTEVNGQNLLIEGSSSSATTSSMANAVTVGDVILKVGGTFTADMFATDIAASTAVTNTLNSLTIDNTASSSTANITFNATGTVNDISYDRKIAITNDVNIISNGVNAQNVSIKTSDKGFGVGGTFYITNDKTRDNVTLTGPINLKGAIVMSAAGTGEGAKLTLNMWGQTIGGLSGQATQKNYLSMNWGGPLTINTAAGADYYWRGDIANNTTVAFDIFKSGEGSQTLVLTSLKNILRTIGVNAGTLRIDATDVTINLAQTLTFNGGAFANVGDITVGAGNLNSGKLIFGNDSGSITIEGALTKAKTLEQFEIDFSGLTTTGEYTIFDADSTSGFATDANEDFIGTNLRDGWTVDFSWNNNQLIANVAVPESATVAALFGALALALAVYRRRK